MSDGARAAIDTAGEALYGASLREFTAERKRLADALRRAGDRGAAAEVLKLPRPTMPAWVVNRLWREARPELDALFAAAGRVRAGELVAAPAQRAALARLRALAGDVLRADGHAAAEGTLSRVMTTLQALAVSGSCDPDPPGRLVADRDPPGFEAMAGLKLTPPAPVAAAPIRASAVERDDTKAECEDAAAEEAKAERAAAAARAAAAGAAAARARAVERERRIAELANLERLAEQARRDEQSRVATVGELSTALRRAEAALADARTRVETVTRAAAAARARLEPAPDEPAS